MASLIILAALAVIAASATVLNVLHDGYRRKPAVGPRREYERDDEYRAWSGAA